MKKLPEETKVYVGMSGGVDSSATAALLKKRGYQVTGVYMKNWTQDFPGMKCPWADDLADAKRVSVQLDIPFKVFDFQDEYRQKVVDYMIKEYEAGRTPNPDVMCNQEIKFKVFLEAALEDDADMIATGHYARTKDGKLFAGADKNKDQSYFLCRVTEDALLKTLFPLGEIEKSKVRELAKELGLATASKKDSQGICFVGEVGIKDFLTQYVTTEPGEIIDKQTGKILGKHDGAIFYTIGQRHGLGLGGGLPYYVVDKNMDKNQVFVTTKINDESLWKDEISLTNLHWINQRPADGENFLIRSRYRAKLVPAKLFFMEDGIKLKMDEAERAITPGQSTVIYKDDQVVGAGIVI